MNRGTFDIPYALFSPIKGVGMFSIPTSYLTYREDAENFIITAGITDTTQINVIRKLVYYLQLSGLWNKIKFCYPFIGGNSTSHSFNLKDPSQYKITYGGTLAHNSQGVTPNGSNGYMNTNYIASNSYFYSNALFLYSTTNNTPPFTDPFDIGCFISLDQALSFIIRGNTTKDKIVARANGNPVIIYQNNDAKGFSGVCRRGSQSALYKNGFKLISQVANGTPTSLPSTPVLIGNGNISTTPGGVSPYGSGWCNQTYAFAAHTEGLTDEEIYAFTLIVEDYQTSLNRNVIVW